jgi:6-phosphogluconolactonase
MRLSLNIYKDNSISVNGHFGGVCHVLIASLLSDVMTKKWRSWACRTAVCLLCAAVGCASQDRQTVTAVQRPTSLWVYVGTYTKSASKGVYLFRLDIDSGSLMAQGLAVAADDPNFLAIAPNQKNLYACATANNHRDTVIDAFAIDPTSGMLRLINQQPSGGSGATHVAVAPNGKALATANYSSGSVALLPIESDGSVDASSAIDQHRGSSINRARQTSPHPHSCNFDPSGRFLFVPDLGMDKIFVYGVDDGKLTASEPVTVAAGSGPRHMAFAPSGKFAYLINEMASTVIAYSYDRGALKEVQTISTLPPGFNKPNTAAEIAVHPNGRFLYASNRGDDSIAIFAIDQVSGTLSLIGFQPTLGKGPRQFAIDPTGNFLIVANQSSDSVVLFRVDPDTGRLTTTGTAFTVSSPVCVAFLPRT